jgi:UDP-glucose 4-epimerase
MKPEVLVFGGAGFIGHYLVSELVARGYSVTVADVNELQDIQVKAYLHVDILDRAAVIDVVRSVQPAVVYNLAGFANLDKAVHFPYQTFMLNVMGNLNILDACVAAKVNRFVYASSAYAMSNKGSFYGISKLSSEKVVEEYGRRYHLPYTILRYGSIYSELPFENNYIYSLVEKAVHTGAIEHKGDGSELREYIHASDAAKLSVDILESEQYVNMHVVLTGTEKMQRKELFELIKEILNGDLRIAYLPEGESHHYRFTPYSFDPTISKKLTANPHIDMGQGILECIRSVHRRNAKSGQDGNKI